MRRWLFDWLSCPFCGGNLRRAEVGNADYGILVCHCDRYPVVAGIPILKKGQIGIAGELVSDVVAMIDGGRYHQALLSMILPPPPLSPTLAPGWIQSLPSVKGIRRLKHRLHSQRAADWRERAAQLLTSTDVKTTACDFLDLYYHRSAFKTDDGYDYFALRFGQPRYLVALSFTSLITEPEKPLLDLACGFGHITQALVRRARGQSVIGVDHNFFGLYVAKRFIAPEAEFVCCVADGPLPFPKSFFSATFCSDAFHYFSNKLLSISELKRVTQENGLIIVVWMHNALWRCPHDGQPLLPEGYQALVADLPHRLVGDCDVLQRYLEKLGPALAQVTEMASLNSQPLLSIIASKRLDVFKDYGAFPVWPHAEGRLGINPLYKIVATSNGCAQVQLLRSFPSTFYIEDHQPSTAYLPEAVQAQENVLSDLAAGKLTGDVQKLIDQFVAVGIPERYQ